MLPTLQRSLIFDLISNFIKRINSGCFQNAPYLAEIKLNNKKLKTISEKAFLNLPSLLLIDLSCNQLENFLSLLGSLRLILLDLRQNKFIHLTSKITSEITIIFLLTEEYYVCCLFPHHSKCVTKKPWYASRQRLFSNRYMKVVAIFISIIILFSNFSCLTMHKFCAKNKTFTFNKIIMATNFTDLKYSLYLLLMLIDDQYFPHKINWKSSPFCFIAFFISLNFNILSPLFLFLATLYRLMVVKYPLDNRFKKSKLLSASIFSSVVTSIIFSTIITAIM